MNPQQGKVPFSCPKCGTANSLKLTSCNNCGIIFERFLNRKQPSQQAHPQVTPQQPPPNNHQQPYVSQPPYPPQNQHHQQVPYHQANYPGAVQQPQPSKRLYGQLPLLQMKHWSRFFLRLSSVFDVGVGGLAQSIRKVPPKGRVASVVQKMLPFIEQGNNLTRSLEMAGVRLPSYVWGHLEAGEISGTLPKSLKTLGDEIERRRKLFMNQIFNWRTLWFFVLLIATSFTLSILFSIGRLSSDEVLQMDSLLFNLVIVAVPAFFVILIPFTMAVITFIWFQVHGKQWFTNNLPFFENLRLSLPITSKVLISETLVRYFSLLSSLISGGLPLPRCLDLAMADVEFPNWRKSFEHVRITIEYGGHLAEGFAKVPHIPEDLLSEIQVGQETGSTSEALMRFVAYLEETAQNIRITLNVVYAMALVMIGAILLITVGVLAVSTYTHLLDLI